MIYSFDIFDTTVTRCVARPKDIFRLMQMKLSDQKEKFPSSLIENFYTARFKAEFQTRVRKYWNKQREITLKDIYELLSSRFHLDQEQSQKLMELELSTEYESISPIAWTLAEIDSLRKANQRIIFVSDMYLPIDFIERLLLKAGAYHKGEDNIYLSSDIGFKKLDGSLFRYILEKEQCLPSAITHFGDDIQSDVHVPYKMGINIYGASGDDIQNMLRSYSYKKIKKYAQYIFQC